MWQFLIRSGTDTGRAAGFMAAVTQTSSCASTRPVLLRKPTLALFKVSDFTETLPFAAFMSHFIYDPEFFLMLS